MPETSTERVRAHRRRKSLEKLAADVQDLAGLEEPPPRDVLLRVLGKKAREGDTAAIRLLLEEYRRDASDEDKPATSVIDQLAARRAS